MVGKEKILKIFKASPTPTSIVKADPPYFTCIGINDAFCEMTQRSESDLIGKSLIKAFPKNPDENNPSEVQKFKNSFLKVIDSKCEDHLYGIRYDIVFHDGNYEEVYWKVINTPVFDEHNNVEFIINSASNITERINAQKEKERAKIKFQNVVEHSTNMFYQHDTEGVLNYVSPQSIDYLGYPPEEAKRKWTEFITDHPVNAEGEKLTQKAIKTGEIQSPYKLQLLTGEGRIIWVEVREAPIIEKGKVTGIIGSLTDITEREKYESELQESLERYKYVTKATRDAIYDWDILKDNIQWGEGFETLFGHAPIDGAFTHKDWVDKIHPADIEETEYDLRFTLNDSSLNKWQLEYRLRKSNGHFAHVLEKGYIIRNEDGKPIRMIGAIRDISEEKQSDIQTKLQYNVAQFFKNEEKLNHILDNLVNYLADFEKFNLTEIWLVSKTKTHLNLISSCARDNVGEKFYAESKQIKKFNLGEGLPGIAWEKNAIVNWGDLSKSSNFKRSEAANISGLQSAVALPIYHNEEIVGILLLGSEGTAESLQNRIHPCKVLQDFLGGEIRRKQQEEEMQLLFESSPDILAIVSPNKKLMKINPSFCELMGYTKEELTTQNLNKFIHKDDLNDSENEFSASIFRQSQPDNFINRWITKSGDIRWISWSSSEEFGEDKYVFTYGRDITEQKLAEKELRKSSKEKETLLAEIHHRVKNNLAVVSGMMQLQAFESDNENLKAKLYDSVVRIKTMASVHELLYQSNSFSELEFSETVKKLVENISQTLQPRQKITLNVHCDPLVLNINQAIPASLIVNEVITNAYKHAFEGADSGNINFSLTEENNKIIFEIKDSGTGFNVEDPINSGSLGMHLIKVLTEQIQGTCAYKNNDEGDGTVFRLSFERMKTKKGIGNTL